ncbi:hypothetical protein StoSoilB13_49470 (plasmid) [Arthrobacter sp. StoSoilB13]|nr:hypothetical protein StoSoilB13_49470 [Arthrobacter sp. StoSoilB13]
MKIYSADTWTIEELQEQVADAGRRTILVPPATTKSGVLEVFGQVLDFPEYYGVNLDALNDSLHDFADALSDDDGTPVTMIWQVPAALPNGPFLRRGLRDPPRRRALRRPRPRGDRGLRKLKLHKSQRLAELNNKAGCQLSGSVRQSDEGAARGGQLTSGGCRLVTD